ncbi:MAG: hypothetical protein JWO10_367, partial [Microbacteriaceae bacterium]|nr:hypothetical protein [Microbacteriaceae bacterium]
GFTFKYLFDRTPGNNSYLEPLDLAGEGSTVAETA